MKGKEQFRSNLSKSACMMSGWMVVTMMMRDELLKNIEDSCAFAMCDSGRRRTWTVKSGIGKGIKWNCDGGWHVEWNPRIRNDDSDSMAIHSHTRHHTRSDEDEVVQINWQPFHKDSTPPRKVQIHVSLLWIWFSINLRFRILTQSLFIPHKKRHTLGQSTISSTDHRHLETEQFN